jgi:cytoplasmic iron level regulating protein YaaA (DUF328/UPF0246 family)
MLILLSPAKSLDYESPLATKKSSVPRLVEESERLVDIMRHKSPAELAEMMKISDELAHLNWERFQEWEPDFDAGAARPAILAFDGDVYRGLGARERFGERDFTYAQRHLRILSGLHGLLRPLDLIHPYRLEMGSRLDTDRGTTLVEFWGDRITRLINEDLESVTPKVVVNLASNEYFQSVDTANLAGRVISPVFKDEKNGTYRIISFFAKAARGEMAAWLLLNRVKTIKGIRGFDVNGYRYDPAQSSPDAPVFLRPEH